MAKATHSEESPMKEIEKLNCGIIMPISAIDGCTPDHWKEVLGILKDTIFEAGFEPRLVSDSDDSGIIQNRIIQNVYNDPIVVCDVSCKNPNVMFELGMRLAFDKPTIIIKDDKTDYTFDMSIIEHLGYPRDLRFTSIIKFKQSLTEKIAGTYKKATEDKEYTTFLKHFGNFKVSKLEEKDISKEDFIIKSIEDLRTEMRRTRGYSRQIIDEDSDFGSLKLSTIKLVQDEIKDYANQRGISSIDMKLISSVEFDEIYRYLSTKEIILKNIPSGRLLRKYLNFLTINDFPN